MTMPENSDEVRVYSPDHNQLIRVHGVPGGIELMVDLGDENATLLLDLRGIRSLRLEMARRERALRKEQD